MTKRTGVIALIVLLAIVAVFSACTLVVSHERETFIRSAQAGSGVARLLIAGANFWSRYTVFFLIGCFSLFFFARRLSMEMGRW